MSDAEKRVQIEQQAGLLTEYEARQRIIDLHRQTIPLLEAQIPQMEALAKATNNIDEQRKIERLKIDLLALKATTSDTARSFEYGMRSAFDSYIDDAGNAAKQARTLIGDGLKGMEDMLANFVAHGKLDFHSLVESIKMDLARLAAQKFIVQVVGNVTGAGTASSASSGIFGNAATSALGSSLQFSGTGGLASQGGAVLDSWLGTTATWDVAAGAQMSAAGELAASAGMFESAVAAIPGWGWALGGAAMLLGGESLFGGDGDTNRTGNFAGKLGQAGVSTDNHWFGGMDESFSKFNASLVAADQTMIKNLGLTQEQIDKTNAALDTLGSKQYDFGMEHTDFLTSSQAAQQIMADRTTAIAGAIGMTVQQLAAEMTLSTDTLKAAYNDAILTDTEKLALKTDAVRAEFEKLGEVMPSTIADYSKLVDAKAAAAAADDSIRPLYRNLLKLAPAFAEVSKSTQSALEAAQKAAQDAVNTAQSAYDAATKNLQSAYQSEIAGKQALADQMGKYVQSLRGYRDSLMLGTLGGLSPEARYAEARRQMEDVSRRAQLGDPAAIEQWQSASTAFLESSQAYNASSAAYVQDRDAVLTMTQNLESVAGRQVDLQTQQVSVLRSQLDALGGINSSVLSLADALSAQSAAKTALTQAKNPGLYPEAAISAAYQQYLGRAPDAGGAAYWSQQVSSGAASVSSVVGSIATSREAGIVGLYESLLGRAPDAGGLDYWMNSGQGVDQLRDSFLGSQEYKSLHGFADGGVASAGYYIAHENELIYSDAATRIHPAEQTSAIFDRINRPAANDSGETVLEIRRQTAAIERQNQLLEKLLSAVEDAEQSNSADLRGLKQHLAHIMSRKAA